MGEFRDLCRAGYAGIWVPTQEEQRAIEALCTDAHDFNCYTWDVMSGLKDKTGKATPMPNPPKALESILSFPKKSILFVKDFHKYIGEVSVFRTFKNLLPQCKATDRHIVVISPVQTIPVECEKDFHIFDFQLPTEEELFATAERLVSDIKKAKADFECPIEMETIRIGKGLTINEFENVASKCLVKLKHFDKTMIEQEKLQTIKKSGLMEIYEPIPLDQLVMPELVKYIQNRKRGFFDPELVKIGANPRGILLGGLPGSGKTLCGKVIAAILGVPCIHLDLGTMMGSKVGESEGNLRRSLGVIDALGACVILMDEVEKMIGGVASSDKVDGGTTSRMFANLLTHMQESKSPHYWIGTCNDMAPILNASQGAFLRRFDDLFFVDVPSLEERMAILKIMNRRFKQNIDLALADEMQDWTGAEIEKFVRASIYDGVEIAKAMIRPVFQQNREVIEKARNWAKDNARRANGSPTAQAEGRSLSL